MKLLAITLLAVCLIQGNSAQFSGLRNLARNAVSTAQGVASNARSAVSNSVSGAVSTAQGVASNARNAVYSGVSGAASTAQDVASNAKNTVSSGVSGAVSTAQDVASNAVNAASNVRNSLSGGAQALLDSASADLSIDSLTEAAKNLSPSELMETIKGATAEVEARTVAIQNQLESAVGSVTQQAEDALKNTVNSWNGPVGAVAQKALAAGIDIKECAVDGVANLSKESVTSAVKCVTDKVNEAVTLTKNIAGLPVRAARLTKDGITGYNACRSKSNTLIRRVCQTAKLAPVAVKSALLVKDTVKYTFQAATLVTTLKSQMTACAADVTTKTGVKVANTGAKIVSCVTGKMTGN